MITFGQYNNGETSIKHCTGLCMGWMVRDLVSGREYLYAVDHAGRALRCDAPLGTDDFDTRRRTWWPVDAVPASAEWIGHYAPPRKIAAARREA